MKLSCTKENLHQGLSIVSHLTNKNVNLPILQNVLVKAEGGTIRLTTTNLEMAVNCTIRGKVDEAGEATIPSKLFFDYVSLLPSETVTIDGEAEVLKIVCGSYKTKMNGLPSTEFPLVPQVQGTRSFKIPAEDLRVALGRVLFAVASNESRPELTGVSMQFMPGETEGKLVLASTDSYRLAEATISLVTAPTDSAVSVIVPAKTLSEVARILSVFRDDVDVPSSVQMDISDNQAVFSYGPVELISRIIEGNYPDYRQIIPKQYETHATIDRDDFVQAVKTASLFSKTGLFDVALELDPLASALSVKALDATRGENVAACGAIITGKNNGVTLNYRYLLDGMNAIGTEQLAFQMIDTANPCLLTAKDDPSYLYIVMPIKQ